MAASTPSGPASTVTTILVIGSGAREHALAWRLACGAGDTPRPDRRVVTAPGNAGIARELPYRTPLLRGPAGTVELARELGASLVVVGPEQPLVDGVVDACQAAGIPAFGPSQAAAALEGSKAFMKQVARAAGAPTADFVVVTTAAEARGFIDARVAEGRGVVVKASGLCAGKGVVVCPNGADAYAVVDDFLGVSGEPRFGAASQTLVVEDLLPGDELSLFYLCDGARGVLLGCARDHKRLLDGDRGPNTGGMGAVYPLGPAEGVSDALLEEIQRTIIDPTLREMTKRGAPFRGVLFAGVMVEGQTPRLLEYNVRLGDPEAEALLLCAAVDLLPVFLSLARGEPVPADVQLAPRGCGAVVVCAAGGYPDAPRAGDAITGLDEANAVEGVKVFCAGVAEREGGLVTAGGRVLAVTARGDSFDEALDRAQHAAALVHFNGKQLRTDIGKSVRAARP